MAVISKAKISGAGTIELSREAREELKKLVGKTVKVLVEVEEEKKVRSPLTRLCGIADVRIKDGSLNHDRHLVQ